MKRKPKVKSFPDVVFPLPKTAQQLHDEITTQSFHFKESFSDAKRYGIEENDFVVIFRSYAFNENQLSIWKAVDEKIAYCGIAYENFGDIAINFGNGTVRHFRKNEVEYCGSIVGIIKPHSVDLKAVLENAEVSE